MTLTEFFKENNKVALGFSGGVDSSYLLYKAIEEGADVTGYYVKSPFQPMFEFEDAKRLAKDIGAKIKIIEIDVLQNEIVAQNPSNRCYYCKTAIFSLIKEQAIKDGYSVLLDGTNASDDADDRPGMKAINELQVKSPLRQCNLTKSDVRVLSKEAGLFTWNKPSYACLATRVPSGTAITHEILEKVEKSEDFLFSMGFTDFRVRVFHGAGKLQLPANQINKCIEKKDEILKGLSPYFKEIFLDLKGR